jgi:hypothetical protein
MEDCDEPLLVFWVDKVIFPKDALGLDRQLFELAPLFHPPTWKFIVVMKRAGWAGNCSHVTVEFVAFAAPLVSIERSLNLPGREIRMIVEISMIVETVRNYNL